MLSDVTSQEKFAKSASKDKKRLRDAYETRKKRKDRGYKSSRVLSNDGSPVPIDYMHTKQLPQENTSEKDKTESKHSNSLIQTRPQQIKNALQPRKKGKEKENVTLLIAVKYQALRRENTRMVSCREYYCYKFQIRSHIQSILFYSRRLLQQYAVDMYIKLETTRLDYCRNNQAELRSEYYQGIVDSISCGETRGHEIGKCKSHYPRNFCEITVQGEDGYPIYRRRNDGQTADVRRAKLNNQWVVPYNPYLLMRYDCHINVEVCSGLTAVKYLYKYIYKGHDKVAVHIASGNEVETIDEIKNFQDARWVSAQEALWRIFEFEMNEMSPDVINLALYFPNKHCVTFWKNQSLDNVLSQDHNSKTMLTEFFHTCSISTKAKTLLYAEFPEYYVWQNQSKCWYERKKRKAIGRVNAANPAEGERYYLRLLLNHVRGLTSFDYLLIVNRSRCFTFKESAQKRDYLNPTKDLFTV
ncbi:uncharacterized protein [Henckelia pumila]|uniref:uncharacterized protein n=1 Tax=Henckelia pumila TaxID=405737 RepID=UPI003C6DC806